MNQIAPFRNRGQFLYASSTLQTEAMACLFAIKWVHTTGFSNIQIISDSELLVRYLASHTHDDISIVHTLSEIREISASFHSCRITKVSMAQVQQAHVLANFCRTHRINVG